MMPMILIISMINYQDRVKIKKTFKGCLDPSHFIFETNFGKKRIRHTTTLKLNEEFLDRLKID